MNFHFFPTPDGFSRAGKAKKSIYIIINNVIEFDFVISFNFDLNLFFVDFCSLRVFLNKKNKKIIYPPALFGDCFCGIFRLCAGMDAWISGKCELCVRVCE